MTLNWIATLPGIGSSFGYSTYQRRLREALERAGVVFDKAADTVVHVLPPYYFELLRFKKNILTTALEYDRIPSQWNHFLDKADLIIVWCRQNQKIFSAATDTPVEVCPGGVEVETFPYVKREKTDPFVFLYLGDDNPRKGIWHIVRAWKMWNDRYPDLAKKTLLIMKMTAIGKPQKRQQVTFNSYIDHRVLPLRESEDDDLPTLGSLYAYANAFLFPSMGEGWGLPLCEAMCTGLPCIYTPQGGPEDFVSEEYAYPIEYGLKKINSLDPRSGGKLDSFNAADPKIESIVERMHEIYTDYDTALDKGLTAAGVMRTCFTWDNAAKIYIDILERNIA